MTTMTEKTSDLRDYLLDTAMACGAVLTGTPDGKEPITVVFTTGAWRAFDRATKQAQSDADELRRHGQDLAASEIWASMVGGGRPDSRNTCCVCGTTEDLYKDGWYGYRCHSEDCMVF